jgi:hypothetical protein
MFEGFWLVQYEGLQGNGGGVITLIKGRVFGGDSQSTYIGTYEPGASDFSGTVRVHNYIPGVASIIGIEGDYDLKISGKLEGDTINGSGVPVGLQVAGLAFRLTRIARIPD